MNYIDLSDMVLAHESVAKESIGRGVRHGGVAGV
jgi:hypothetical protein